MDDRKATEARDAWDRIDAAIGDQDRTITTVTVEDEDGRQVPGERIPMAHVVANDVVTVGGLIPLEKRTEKARDLRRGAAKVEPHRTVMCQCACLHALLEEAKPYLPPAPVPAAAAE